MKNVLILLSFIFTSQVFALFQKDLQSNRHFADMNTLYLQDGTNDYIIAGSKFNSSFTNTRLSLTRIDDATGNVVWTKSYEDVMFTQFRGFDIDRFNDGVEKLVLTGTVKIDSTGFNHLIIAQFEALSGNLIIAKTYGGIGNHPNAQGLHVIYTESMINMMPMPGFVIAGFLNDAYSNTMSNSNIGFVTRVDINLTPLWTKTLDNDFLAGVDYDVVNNITETNDGYFLTGSRSKLMSVPPYKFQEVLAMKINFYGDFVWESSYLQNLGNGIGADAKYDAVEDNIYLLANYDNHQFFGVTVIANSTGIINTISSWYGQEASTQGWFGFELTESFDSNNMVVHGYRRDNMLLNTDDVLVNVKSTPFAYEFVKSSGAQIQTMQYDVLYEAPALMNDFFYFWNTSIPKAYFPDMAFISPMSEMKYFTVGYRTQDVIDTKIEMIQTGSDFLNECNHSLFNITVNPITPFIFNDTLSNSFLPFSAVTFTASIPMYALASCETGGYIIDPGTAVSELKNVHFKVYPNPTNSLINLDINGDVKQVSIENTLGQTVLIVQNTNKEINVSQLNKGIYTIKVHYNQDETLTSKFVKQ